MNMHPDDRTLQRYLNKRSHEVESKRITLHLRTCLDCRRRLSAYMDMELLLDELPLLEAPSGMPDRVLDVLRLEKAAESGPNTDDRHRQESGKRASFWRAELANGLVATAATFLFIYSGIVGKLVSLDAAELEEGVRSGSVYLHQTIKFISQQLLT